MKENGIKLNIDRPSLSLILGSAKTITDGEDKDYISNVDMILPIVYRKIPDGIYTVEYKGYIVKIKITRINKKEDDPVFNIAKEVKNKKKFMKDSKIDSGPDTMFESIPFEAFTDNRGKYPAVMATLVFPRRIASWLDATHKTGVNLDFDIETLQVTGIPQSEEKILALKVLNRLFHSLKINNLPRITYEDVSVFLERYFKEPFKEPLIIKISLFSSKNAYKNAVYDYLLPNREESKFSNSVMSYQKEYEKKEINNEKDLKSAIEEAIENVLKHHIEIRRWIEPFWDGQRTIKLKGEKIEIPRSPKNEPKIQPTLHVILDMALLPLGIQVIRESDEGIGSLDFRFLFTTTNGNPLSVGVEFKLAHHKNIKHGITRQLPEYLKAIKSSSGIFVVMWFKDSKFFKEPNKYEKEAMETYISEQAEDISAESGMEISTVILDASIRPSASNL